MNFSTGWWRRAARSSVIFAGLPSVHRAAGEITRWICRTRLFSGIELDKIKRRGHGHHGRADGPERWTVELMGMPLRRKMIMASKMAGTEQEEDETVKKYAALRADMKAKGD